MAFLLWRVFLRLARPDLTALPPAPLSLGLPAPELSLPAMTLKAAP